MPDVSLRCSCGTIRGRARDVSPDRGNRVVCYCDDCQSFAYFLGRDAEVLDAHGGTDIFQMSPSRIEIAQGADRMACVRLTGRGALRWYADCCRTPIGNTGPSPRPSFIGTIHSFMDHAGDGRSRDEAIGPVRSRVNARFARADRSALDAHDRAPPSMILRFFKVVLFGGLRGSRSPFFDPETGAPRATPLRLSAEEPARVEAARDARQNGNG